MAQTPQLEAIDTKTRVNSFFMWQDIMESFAKDFYLDCQLLIKDMPSSPGTYLNRLKRYHDKIETHTTNWSNLAEILDLINLPTAIDYLREWYKSIIQVDRHVEDYIERLSKVQNLDQQRTSDVRMYEFVDVIRPLCVTFIDAKDGIVKAIKKQFFATLNRTPIEIRLFDNLKQKFNQTYEEFSEVKIAFRMVEEEGAFKHFDGVFSNMALQINELSSRLKTLTSEFELVDDDQLMTDYATMIGMVKRIDQLVLEIPKQQTYSIQGFEHGAIGSDVFEVIQKINRQVVYLDREYLAVIDRLAELMSV
ncbi:hypothetical protein D3P96_07710 [Weissella viridescens]|uniref:Uncharacterized protein n=1 Tax=Weissella viridescens TaxID=1629 RepID=A0A3P2RE41_WEIVI|nr:hypothetical protein [Weissella viridescens]RRG17431.1 hypothetical protein D3P96_07710 [Weissella viridescens]